LAEFWQYAKLWRVFEIGGHTYYLLLGDRFITLETFQLPIYFKQLQDNIRKDSRPKYSTHLNYPKKVTPRKKGPPKGTLNEKRLMYSKVLRAIRFET